MNWDAADYAAALLLIGGGAVTYLAACLLIKGARARMAAGAAVILAVALVWAQLAVGIF